MKKETSHDIIEIAENLEPISNTQIMGMDEQIEYMEKHDLFLKKKWVDYDELISMLKGWDCHNPEIKKTIKTILLRLGE